MLKKGDRIVLSPGDKHFELWATVSFVDGDLVAAFRDDAIKGTGPNGEWYFHKDVVQLKKGS